MGQSSSVLTGFSKDTDQKGQREIIDLKSELTGEQQDDVLATVLQYLKLKNGKNIEVCILATRIFSKKAAKEKLYIFNSPALFGFSEDTDQNGRREEIDLKSEVTDEQQDDMLATVLQYLKPKGSKTIEVCIVATRIYSEEVKIEAETNPTFRTERKAFKNAGKEVRYTGNEGNKLVLRKKPRY